MQDDISGDVMKLKLMLMLAASGFVLSSCSEKNDGDGVDGTVMEEEKVDTAESLTDEIADEFNKLSDALKSIEDKESAEAAAEKINEVGKSMVALAKRAEEIAEPSEEKKKELDAKMEERMKVFQKDLRPIMTKMMQKPEVAQIVMGAMEKFTEQMEEAEAGFQKLGKDSNE